MEELDIGVAPARRRMSQSRRRMPVRTRAAREVLEEIGESLSVAEARRRPSGCAMAAAAGCREEEDAVVMVEGLLGLVHKATKGYCWRRSRTHRRCGRQRPGLCAGAGELGARMLLCVTSKGRSYCTAKGLSLIHI